MPRNAPNSATRTPAKPKAQAASPTTVKPNQVKAAAKPASQNAQSSRKAATCKAPSTEAISLRAYEIWLSKGRPIGRDEENWLQAESELKAND